MSIRSIRDRAAERKDELERLELLALEELERVRTEWFPHQVAAEMPVSLVFQVIRP